MEAIVKDGKLVITIDMVDPEVSTSGKSLILASTHGNQTTSTRVKVKGKEANLVVSVNAYVPVKAIGG